MSLKRELHVFASTHCDHLVFELVNSKRLTSVAEVLISNMNVDPLHGSNFQAISRQDPPVISHFIYFGRVRHISNSYLILSKIHSKVCTLVLIEGD